MLRRSVATLLGALVGAVLPDARVANACVGDCDADGVVALDELIVQVNTALGRAHSRACTASCGPSGNVPISCLVGAVANSLDGCPPATPTPVVPEITYRLIPGSGLVEYPAGAASTFQFLWGTFTVAPLEPIDDAFLFRFAITNVDIEGEGISIVGESGNLQATTEARGGRVEMSAAVAINEVAVDLLGEEPLSVLWGYPPTIDGLSICGAPGADASCEEIRAQIVPGHLVNISAVPETTQTPGPTPTPLPVVLVRYRVAEGSTIERRASGGALAAAEPLSGTLTLSVCDPRPPNTYLFYEIMEIDLQSASFSVATGGASLLGCAERIGAGHFQALTLDFPPRVDIYACASINGQQVFLSGAGPFDPQRDPPAFADLAIAGVPPGRLDCGGTGGDFEGRYEINLSAFAE